MVIQKQEFYEGAALHQLIRGSRRIECLTHEPPFFVVGAKLVLHLKYSTAKRSPWAFTFGPHEQVQLHRRAQEMLTVIGLICGPDGVAAVRYEDFARIARMSSASIRIACRRKHRERFEVAGPEGVLARKVAPSDWLRLLEGLEGECE